MESARSQRGRGWAGPETRAAHPQDNSAFCSDVLEGVQPQGAVHKRTHPLLHQAPTERNGYPAWRAPEKPKPVTETRRSLPRGGRQALGPSGAAQLATPPCPVPFPACALPARSLHQSPEGDTSPRGANSTSNLTSNLSRRWAGGCGTGGRRDGPRAKTVSNSPARWVPEAVETHREGRAQGGREAEAGLRSPGAGAALGMAVFLLARGRGAVEDNQDWGPGPPPRGTQGQRHQWGPRGSPAGVACSSAGTRSSPRKPWVPAGLMGTGAPEAHCRKRRAGRPRGRGPAGALRGRWGPRTCPERGCRAEGREGPLMAGAAVAAVVVAADLQPQGVSPGGWDEVGEVGGEEGRRQPAPGTPWVSSLYPGASPREPGAGGTASSWRRRSPETSPRAPRPPGTSQPWPGRQRPQWQQGSAGIQVT